MKILFPCDGSACSERAAHYLITQLRPKLPDLDLTVLFVDVPMLDRVAAALGEETVARIHRENGEVALKNVRRRLKRAGIAHAEALASGNVAGEIARRAERGKFDLVLMGSHGRTALKNLLLGSVTSSVLARGKVPVLIVH